MVNPDACRYHMLLEHDTYPNVADPSAGNLQLSNLPPQPIIALANYVLPPGFLDPNLTPLCCAV